MRNIASVIISSVVLSILSAHVVCAAENQIFKMKYPTTDITPEFVENNFLETNGFKYAYSLGETAKYNEEPAAGTVVLPLDESRIFTVNTSTGKATEYLLLDKDENGNYFVADKAPATAYWRYWDIDNETGAVDASSAQTNLWKFDIARPNPKQSLANFLNNSFLTKNEYLPNVMEDYLVEKDWVVGADSAVDYTGQQTAWSTAKKEANQEYTTRGKMAILSAQEYITYIDILGYTYTTYEGTALRTPASIVRKNSSGETVYECGPMSVFVQGSHVWMRYGYQPKNSRINLQKCFWLDKDFFKEVKLDLTKTGSTVKMLLKEQGYEVLSDIYTEKELGDYLGLVYEELPKAENIKLSGTPSVGTKLECLYEYSSAINCKEAGTKFLWYLSEDKSSQGELIEITSTPAITIQDKWVGKYLKAFISPQDSEGRKGITAWDCEPMVVLPRGDFAVTDSGFENGRAWVKVCNLSGTQFGVRVFLVAYNESGNIVSINQMLEGSETDTYEYNEIPVASEYRILVLTANGNQPLKKILK